MNKIDIKDYEEKIKEEKYEDIYEDLVNKTIIAVQEFGKRKDYKIPEDKKGKDLFYNIQFYFKENFIDYLSVYYLMQTLIEWNYKDEEENGTYEKKINNIVVRYNSFIDKINEYEKIESEVKQKGIDIVKKEREENMQNNLKKDLNIQKSMTKLGM